MMENFSSLNNTSERCR